MISQDTLETALNWYHTGISRIESRSFNLGINYLDKAIVVFSEQGDWTRLTYARHYKLVGLRMEERHEEVESQFAAVMQGYVRLADTYGQGLLLAHLAESLAERGRWERANSYYNLAAVIAENDRHAHLLAYVYQLQALLFMGRDDPIHADQLLQRAERFAQDESLVPLRAYLRHLRGEALLAMGEFSEAAAMLEDAQNLRIRAHLHREALQSLNLLKQIYDNTDMAEDRGRIAELIHFCGQQLLKTDSLPRHPPGMEPSIVRGR